MNNGYIRFRCKEFKITKNGCGNIKCPIDSIIHNYCISGIIIGDWIQYLKYRGEVNGRRKN